ncbi:MAG: M55 family metallopeptidase [Anaerolineae bacterium]
MKILIAADMEGVTGVVHWDHVTPGHAEYPRYRRLMTADVNAAVRGVFEGGAEEVIVTDGHNAGRNLLIEELDPRARLNAGDPSPFSMVEGIDAGVTAAIFIGYHARAGAPEAILSHTWSSTRVAGVWLNGKTVGEIGLNAAVCGHFEAPVIMLSGDQTACAEATGLLGEIETAVVKRATSRMAAECLSPEATQAAIQTAAVRAMRRLGAGEMPPPFRLQSPISLAVEFVQPEMADRAMLLPGARRSGGKTVEVSTEDAPAAYRAFQAMVALASG